MIQVPRSRKGFTLFHLLIVVVILLILFALLLPAIARVRMAAARMSSANNLKQIGIACHNYHDVHGTFPPGVDDRNFSAAARLLPYIEQNNLFNSITFTKPMEDKANATVRATRIKVFLSPQDPVTSVNNDYGATNYLFNAGSRYALKDNDGVLFLNSKVKIQTIPDGSSNTLMAVETLKGDGGVKAMDVKRQHVLLKKTALKGLKPESGVKQFKANKNIAANRCASWMDGRFLQGTFTGTRVLNDPRPDVDCAGVGGLSGARSVSDRTNILMCDGSVHSITGKSDLTLWNRLSAANDGKLIGDF